jgi:intracellular multiplication protein IcmS
MDLYERCKQLAFMLGYKFILRGRKLTQDEVFSDTGMLPVIVDRANKLCVLCFGYGIGVTCVDDKRTMAGRKMVVDEKAPKVLAMIFIADVLIDIASSNQSEGQVVLDELLLD